MKPEKTAKINEAGKRQDSKMDLFEDEFLKGEDLVTVNRDAAARPGGTVDRFQGQQAEVVVASTATSVEAYLPRNIDFLYSKNRLKVALSRARSLAVLAASPELMSINCSRPEEAALVNALCRVQACSGTMK